MTTRYTPKHTHIPHARSSDPELYYKIVFFTLFGHTINDISILTDGIPVQTIARNFKIIRTKLSRNLNYLTEVHNRFFHADPVTGLYHGKWVSELRSLQPAWEPRSSKQKESESLTEEQKDRTERLVECLKDCPIGEKPKNFIEKYVKVGNYNSDVKEVTTAFDPLNRPHPFSMPILQDIDYYMAFIKRKKTCKACRLCRRDKETYFEIFVESPYTYIDIAYHLSRFQPKNIEDYNGHLFYAWINGSMRGIHHMKANKTALKAFSFEEQLQISNLILLNFVQLTYDAIAGKVLPSLPLPD